MKQLRRRHHYWLVGGLIGLMVLVALAGVMWWLVYPRYEPTTVDTQPSPPPVVPQQVSSSMLVFGNAFWGRNTHDWSMASPLKTAYPFSRLDEFDRDKYDAWIAGLECPTDPDVHMTAAEQEAKLQFNCSPEFLPEAAKWFTIFTLANNHTDNQGVDGFETTKQLLDKNNIQYFGHYDPRVIEDACEVIGLPVTINNSDETVTKGKLPVAMCGYHGVFRIPPDEAIAEMEQYAKLMPVFAFPHMGVEYEPAPDQLKTSLYRSMIDHGADVVLGDHPHWIQNTEAYKGHLIVYSMGNFMFDQQGSVELTRSAAIQVKLKTNQDDSELLSKWLAIGETCSSFRDDCLDKIVSQQLPKLDISYQFGVLGTDDSDKITKPATPDQMQSILQRLQWSNTMSQLQAPYGRL